VEFDDAEHAQPRGHPGRREEEVIEDRALRVVHVSTTRPEPGAWHARLNRAAQHAAFGAAAASGPAGSATAQPAGRLQHRRCWKLHPGWPRRATAVTVRTRTVGCAALAASRPWQIHAVLTALGRVHPY